MSRGALGLVLAVLSCKVGAKQKQCDAGGCKGGMTVNRWDFRPPQQLDLLVVVDPQALGDGARVRAGLAHFVHAVALFPGTLVFPAAVVSSVLDTAGAPVSLLSGPCAPRELPYLKDAPRTCGATPNFDGTFDDALACLGPAADGPNQPLEVVRRVTGADAAAAYRGFWRERTLLLVVIISARDDASAGVTDDPAGLRAYLDGLEARAGVPFPLAL